MEYALEQELAEINFPEEKCMIETTQMLPEKIFELDQVHEQQLLDRSSVGVVLAKEAPQPIDQILEEAFKIWLTLQDATRKYDGEYTIFRVPDNIRLHDSRVSNPMIVPIGPYHHVHKRLSFREMEAHKPDCITYLLSVAPHEGEEGELKERCLSMLKDLETKARGCYSDNTRLMESEHFTEMLLRDGCFIIYLLLTQDQKTDYIEQTSESQKTTISLKIRRLLIDTKKLNYIKLDLLKLENQIPFFVIRTLFEFIMPDLPPYSLVDLTMKFFEDLPLSKARNIQKPNIDDVHHLLHLMHISLAPSTIYQTVISARWDPELPSTIDAPTWIPSAKELQDSGVRFRSKNDSSGLLDITFNEGTMEIPILQVYNSTAVLISNLVAFENCFANAGAYITSYVAFLNCLMHSEEDVRLLHLNGVVINKMSTDKKLAEYFSQICSQCSPGSKPNHMQALFIKVTNHHTRRKNRWMAEAKSKYCSSPWVTLSMAGGLCLLWLTFLQTTFTIIQTAFDLKRHGKG